MIIQQSTAADPVPNYEPEARAAADAEVLMRQIGKSVSASEVCALQTLGALSARDIEQHTGAAFSPVRRRLSAEGGCPVVVEGPRVVPAAAVPVTEGQRPKDVDEDPIPFAAHGPASVDAVQSFGSSPILQPDSQNGRLFVCKMCLQMWRTASALRMHQQEAHGSELPYQCHVCNKRFFWSGSLSRHLRIHSGSKPYGCSTCGKCFTQSGTLQRHTRTHTGEKPYECQLCWRKFSTNSNLSQHMKTHRKNGDFVQRSQLCENYPGSNIPRNQLLSCTPKPIPSMMAISPISMHSSLHEQPGVRFTSAPIYKNFHNPVKINNNPVKSRAPVKTFIIL